MTVPESIVARLAAGEPVTAAELVEAEAGVRLSEAQEVLDAARAEQLAAERWLVAVDEALSVFAGEADDVVARLLAAVDAFTAQVEPLQALQIEAGDVIRRGVDSLLRLGWPVHPWDIYASTGGRVLIDPEMVRESGYRVSIPWAEGIRRFMAHAETRTDFPRH